MDFALINECRAEDIIVTQDYGVAAMALGKGAHPIHQSGKWYTNENIDRMLMERHLAKKARMGKGKHHLKGPAISFDPYTHGYYKVGGRVGEAFRDGLKIK